MGASRGYGSPQRCWQRRLLRALESTAQAWKSACQPGKTVSSKQPRGLASFGTARWGLALAPRQEWGGRAPAPGAKWDPGWTQVSQLLQPLQKGPAHPLWKVPAEYGTPPLHLGMLPAPLNFTGTSFLSACPWLGTWAAQDPQEGGTRSEGSKLTSSGSAATSSHGHPVPKPRLAPRLQTLPAVPFPGLSKVSATKMPLAWEELEPVRKKNSLVPRDSPGCGCQGLLELVGAQLTSVGQRHGPSPGVCPVALSAWRGEAWVGGLQHLCSRLGNGRTPV